MPEIERGALGLRGKSRFKGIFAILMISLVLSGCQNQNQGAPKTAAEPEILKVSDSGATKPMVIKFGHVVREKTAADEGARYFAELVKKKSEGKMIVEVYPNSILGGNREMLEALKLGTLGMVTPSVASIAGITDKALLFDLPYLFKDNESAEAVLAGEVGRQVLKDMDGSGIIGLTWWFQGWRQITTRDREVHAPADLKGLKIRVMDNPLHISHFNSIGAYAVPMAYSEVFTALQQGVIDGQENPYTNIKMSGFSEVQKYIIETRHIYDPAPVLFSNAVWNKMNPQQQQIIKESIEEATVWQIKHAGEQDEKTKRELIDSGKVKVIELTESERAAFREAAQPVYKQWEEKIGKELIKKVLDAQR